LCVKDGMAKKTTGPFTSAAVLPPPPGRQAAIGQLQLEARPSDNKGKSKARDPSISTFMNALTVKENNEGAKKAQLAEIEARKFSILLLLRC